MRREGFEVNGKRVARIRIKEGIKVSKKQRRMKRLRHLDGRANANLAAWSGLELGLRG